MVHRCRLGQQIMVVLLTPEIVGSQFANGAPWGDIWEDLRRLLAELCNPQFGALDGVA